MCEHINARLLLLCDPSPLLNVLRPAEWQVRSMLEQEDGTRLVSRQGTHHELPACVVPPGAASPPSDSVLLFAVGGEVAWALGQVGQTKLLGLHSERCQLDFAPGIRANNLMHGIGHVVPSSARWNLSVSTWIRIDPLMDNRRACRCMRAVGMCLLIS